MHRHTHTFWSGQRKDGVFKINGTETIISSYGKQWILTLNIIYKERILNLNLKLKLQNFYLKA
jgi:hypothetical protein